LPEIPCPQAGKSYPILRADCIHRFWPWKPGQNRLRWRTHQRAL